MLLRPVCQRCGRSDHTVRVATFTWVLSLVLFSTRQPTTGIWCGECRKRVGQEHALRSALLGWWGIPWGPFWTVGSISRALAGGDLPPDANAALLATLGAQLVGRDLEAAKSALRQSLGLREDPEVRRLLNEITAPPRTAETLPESAPAQAPAPVPAPDRSLAASRRVSSLLRPGQTVACDGAALHDGPDLGTSVVRAPVGTVCIVLAVRDGSIQLAVPGRGMYWVRADELRN